jgi:transposase
VVDEIGNHLDFSGFEREYRGGGRPAFHPQLIGTIVVYGMCSGVLSARELAQRLEYDTRFMWLAHEQHIDHEVFSDFRRRFGPQIKDLFKETVRLALRLGLVSLAHVAIDGTKIAAAAQRRALNKDDLDKAIARLDERIEKLLAEAEALDTADEAELGHLRGDEVPQELATAQARQEKLQALLPLVNDDAHKRISPTDPEAPLQKTQDGKRPGYNAQIAVDEKVGIIVAADVTCEQNDTQQFEPMAEQTIANVQQTPEVIATDTGYHSGEALEYLERKPELNAYINQSPSATPDLYGHEDFEYDTQTDTYRCPAGQRLGCATKLMIQSMVVSVRPNGVIPFPVEGVRFEFDCCQLFVGDAHARRICSFVGLGLNSKSLSVRGGCDQFDDDLVADQRPSPPVHGNVREEAMLDLVPLAGSGRQMTDRDVQSRGIGKPLQLDLPET